MLKLKENYATDGRGKVVMETLLPRCPEVTGAVRSCLPAVSGARRVRRPPCPGRISGRLMEHVEPAAMAILRERDVSDWLSARRIADYSHFIWSLHSFLLLTLSFLHPQAIDVNGY